MSESESEGLTERLYRIVEVSEDELRGLRPDPGEVEPPPPSAAPHHHDFGTHHDHDVGTHHHHDHDVGAHHDHDHGVSTHDHHHPPVLKPSPF